VKRTLLVIGLVLLGPQARADEDFRPEEGTFAGYGGLEPHHLAVREALLGDDQYRLCQLVTLPSFGVESAVYMTENDSDGYTVVSRTLKSEWSRRLRGLANRSGRHKLDDLPALMTKLDRAVVTRTAPLDESTGRMLAKLCGRVLLRVRHPKELGRGNDGVTYHAATWVSLAFPSGRAWSPKKGTLPAEFVELEETLEKLTEVDEGARAKVVAELKDRARRLDARLDALERARP